MGQSATNAGSRDETALRPSSLPQSAAPSHNRSRTDNAIGIPIARITKGTQNTIPTSASSSPATAAAARSEPGTLGGGTGLNGAARAPFVSVTARGRRVSGLTSCRPVRSAQCEAARHIHRQRARRPTRHTRPRTRWRQAERPLLVPILAAPVQLQLLPHFKSDIAGWNLSVPHCTPAAWGIDPKRSRHGYACRRPHRSSARRRRFRVEGARRAISELDRHQLWGRSLTVNEAKPVAARPGGGGFGGGRQRRDSRW